MASGSSSHRVVIRASYAQTTCPIYKFFVVVASIMENHDGPVGALPLEGVDFHVAESTEVLSPEIHSSCASRQTPSRAEIFLAVQFVDLPDREANHR